MRKVNIMVDVSDEVYESVVAPYKKARQFSELINSLLTGYLKDDYVAAYVEGTLDILKSESSRSFDEALKAMNDSLATVAMLNESASSMMSEGIDAVKVGKGKKNGKAEDDYEGEIAVAVDQEDDDYDEGWKESESPQKEVKSNKQEEDDRLRKDVDDLKRQNMQMNENIQMLLNLLQGGTGIDLSKLQGMSQNVGQDVGESKSKPVESEPAREEKVEPNRQGSKILSMGDYQPTDASRIQKELVQEEPIGVSEVASTEDVHMTMGIEEPEPISDVNDLDDNNDEINLFDDEVVEEDDDEEDDDFLSNLLIGQVMSV